MPAGEIDVASVVGLRTAVDELPHAPCPTHDRPRGGRLHGLHRPRAGWPASPAGGCDVTLRAAPEPIRKLLDVTGVGAIVTLAEDG